MEENKMAEVEYTEDFLNAYVALRKSLPIPTGVSIGIPTELMWNFWQAAYAAGRKSRDEELKQK
jgi:hypothetical protein